MIKSEMKVNVLFLYCTANLKKQEKKTQPQLAMKVKPCSSRVDNVLNR